MEVFWIIVAVAAVVAIIAVVAAEKRWQTVKTEGGSRTEQIDRLQAYLRAQGVKSKTKSAIANTIQLKVLRKDVEQAKQLIELFEKEK